MKKTDTYYLSKEIIQRIKDEAKLDSRSKSDWLNLHLTKFFEKGRKPNKAISKPKFDPPFPFKESLIGLGVDESLVVDWLTVRKDKKASNTKTAFNGFLKQVSKSGLSINDVVEMAVENSWKGFKAEWINQANKPDFSDDSTDWVNKDHGLL